VSYPLLLHAKHRGTDVTYQAFGEWMVPWRFDSLEAEYQTLRTNVGLIDYSTLALIQVEGPDRVGFLHNLLTNDIKRLTPGAGCQAALLSASAHLIAECLVLADAEALWLVCDALRAQTLTQALQQYVFSEQVQLTNHERRQAALALQGPRTIECLIQLLGTIVTLPADGDHQMASYQGIPFRIVRHTLTGDVGVLCLCDAEHTERLWEAFAREGTPHGLRLVGWETLNAARIEAGIPWHGIDMDQTNLLPETGLERRIASTTKGCYVGQEIIARMQTYGSANKRLTGLMLEGDMTAAHRDPIRRAGEEVGWVTSVCQSPALKRPIAMGYVKRGAYEPGTPVEILHGDQRLAATVTPLPFISPK
jgi:aminomethyltransferase